LDFFAQHWATLAFASIIFPFIKLFMCLNFDFLWSHGTRDEFKHAFL